MYFKNLEEIENNISDLSHTAALSASSITSTVTSPISEIAHAAALAAATAFVIDASAAAAAAVDSASTALSETDYIWQENEIDIHNTIKGKKLIFEPLWSGKIPEEMNRAWRLMKNNLLRRENEYWDVWTKWYDARLIPSKKVPCYNPPILELEYNRLIILEEVWDSDPYIVNTEIKNVIKEYECEDIIEKTEHNPLIIGTENISYNDIDEPELQNNRVLTFTFSGEGPIDVDEKMALISCATMRKHKNCIPKPGARHRPCLDYLPGTKLAITQPVN